MGKSVDFCHIIIISAIITVYRTAGRPEFSARLYCTGRKHFSRSELQEVLQYYTKSCYELSSENTPTDREH